VKKDCCQNLLFFLQILDFWFEYHRRGQARIMWEVREV